MSMNSRGFTLMELMVAMVLASIFTLTALTFLKETWYAHHVLLESYQKGSSALLYEMRRAHPYRKN